MVGMREELMRDVAEDQTSLQKKKWNQGGQKESVKPLGKQASCRA